MDERFAFLIAAVVPVAAVVAWLIGLQKGIGASIQSRYEVVRNLFIFAIGAVVVTFISIFAVYGSQFGFWWLAVFLAALFSIPTAALLGLGNLILLKRLGASSSPTKDS